MLPLNGSREGLFSAIFIALARKRVVGRPAVLIPNPFYQAYAAATTASGAEPMFLPSGADTGFLPDLDVPQVPLPDPACFRGGLGGRGLCGGGARPLPGQF